MNALNRLVMLILALLSIGVPLLLLLVAFGVVSADAVNSYTRHRGVLDALGSLSPVNLATRARVITAVLSGLLALIALILLLRELTFGRRRAPRHAVLDGSPGSETRITARAIRHLAEGAAQQAGAVSPTVRLMPEGRSYGLECEISASRSSNLALLAGQTRENILNVLRAQTVPVRDVEVTVRGTRPQERRELA